MRFKLTGILAVAIFIPLIWVFAASSGNSPMLDYFGVWTCVAYAAAMSVFSAWLLVMFAIELRVYFDQHS